MTPPGAFALACEPGDPARPNEDFALVTPELALVVDGATARTGTGCEHGVHWYARQLAYALTGGGLAEAIAAVRALHPGCDLAHPGTPSAAVALLRFTDETAQYVVLGDATLVLDTDDGLRVVTDRRIGASASAERAHADALPHGSPEKAAALVAMKHAELAARNTSGGYWIAAADPAAAAHALTGSVPLDRLRRAALLTDGAARAVDDFGLLDWPDALRLLSDGGPAALIAAVRAAEASDASGERWPRNKTSDDATAVLVTTTAPWG